MSDKNAFKMPTKKFHLKCPQMCPQKVFTNKKCPQKVSTKSAYIKCPQKVSTQSVYKKCPQKDGGIIKKN